MKSELVNKVEDLFYDYAQQYDQNIKKLIKQKDIEMSVEELEEVLEDAKNMVND